MRRTATPSVVVVTMTKDQPDRHGGTAGLV